MSRPATRQKNATQRPGQILLDSTQKRRTSEQKRADDTRAEQEKLEREAIREHGIGRLATIINQSVQEEQQLLTRSLQPRPRLKIVQKTHSLQTEATQGSEGADREVSSIELEDEPSLDGSQLPQEDFDHVTARKSRKISSRDAVEAVRATNDVNNVCQADDLGFGDNGKRDKSVTDPKRKQPEHDSRTNHAKANYSGTGEIKDWAEKLAAAKPVHTLLSQRARSQHTRSTSASSQKSLGNPKARQPTPASTRPSTRPSTPGSTAELPTPCSYLDGFDEPNSGQHKLVHLAITSQPKTRRRDTYLEIKEVVSDSEPGEEEPTSSLLDWSTKKDNAFFADDIVEQKPLAGPPPSKRARTSTSQRSGSGAHNKYINNDLPAGATDNNVWRRVFVSTVAHATGTYDNPWNFSGERLKVTLQRIWDTVYSGKNTIPHTVVVGGPVYEVAKKSLNSWRTGFAGAAIAVITMLFAQDLDFASPENRKEFAQAMLTDHHFVFSNNVGLDKKAWTGIWRAPHLLETFAHHFNFIQGYVEVPNLPFSQNGPRAALALACTAYERILTLIANENIQFFPAELVSGWSSYIPKGSQYEFGDVAWGATTNKYLQIIQGLSDDQFQLIMDDTKKYIRVLKPSASSLSSSAPDDKFDNLLEFR